MEIKFTKMHGCGNDYIYINCFNLNIKDPNKLSTIMSPRHFSVGADGVVLILKSEIADAKMRMFNLDGSEGKMCGNAIRCVGKYLYDNKIINKLDISIETLSGIKYLKLYVEDNKVTKVSVDMGFAVFEPKKIPLLKEKEMINEEFFINDSNYKMTAVSMGNPHCVIYLDDIDNLDLSKIGPIFENNELFPERVNTEFIKIVDKNHLKMRVWERGSGETFACGTGACAAIAASCKNGICDFGEIIFVELLGGTLEIKCDENYKITMTGPATKVYDGVFEYED